MAHGSSVGRRDAHHTKVHALKFSRIRQLRVPQLLYRSVPAGPHSLESAHSTSQHHAHARVNLGHAESALHLERYKRLKLLEINPTIPAT